MAGPQLRRQPVFAGQNFLKTAGKLKTGVFALEGLNSLATTWFFYDIYFYTRDQFKFGALQNLLLAALLGAVYAVSAFFGGRFAQKFGYFTAVRWGTGLMAAAILIGSQVEGLPATIAVPGGGEHRLEPDLAGPGSVDERRRTARSIAEFGRHL